MTGPAAFIFCFVVFLGLASVFCMWLVDNFVLTEDERRRLGIKSGWRWFT